ncbi:MAG: ABC transporter substrate-binding protein [Thermomicrobiales bacterium]
MRDTSHEPSGHSSASPSRDERGVRLARTELKELAEAVVAARKQAGLTQRQVAEAMGTDQGNIARLESGRHMPSIRLLQKFARVTDMHLRVAFDPVPPFQVPGKVSHAMTDILSRPSLRQPFASRRHFLGGAMGMAGLLGLSNVKYVTAQEATAAATAAADYVWTPPQYDPEMALFTIVDRNDQTVTVETIDGQIEIPANPQRIVSLGWEYISLFELGVADRLVGVAYTDGVESPLWSAGDLTDAMHTALKDVELLLVHHNGSDLDIEQLVALKPDLILTSPLFTQDPGTLAKIAPTVRGTTHAPFVPRAAVRDFGALFGVDDVAATLLADHETFVERARQTVAPAVEGKKAGVIVYYPENGDCYAYPSYYLENGGVFTTVEGSYQLQRELDITPSSFVEHLADEDGRQQYYVNFSMERIKDVDLDHIFLYHVEGSYDAFVNAPLVQQTVAGKSNQVYDYDPPYYGFGLAGVRAAVAWMVEKLTGNPFA